MPNFKVAPAGAKERCRYHASFNLRLVYKAMDGKVAVFFSLPFGLKGFLAKVEAAAQILTSRKSFDNLLRM